MTPTGTSYTKEPKKSRLLRISSNRSKAPTTAPGFPPKLKNDQKKQSGADKQAFRAPAGARTATSFRFGYNNFVKSRQIDLVFCGRKESKAQSSFFCEFNSSAQVLHAAKCAPIQALRAEDLAVEYAAISHAGKTFSVLTTCRSFYKLFQKLYRQRVFPIFAVFALRRR